MSICAGPAVTKKAGPANWTIRFQPAMAANSEPSAMPVSVLALLPAEAEREHWQVTMELLISAAEKGGIVMMARIAMLRALNHGDPDPAPEPRRNRAKRYRIVR
jgi:hypothetical protein